MPPGGRCRVRAGLPLEKASPQTPTRKACLLNEWIERATPSVDDLPPALMSPHDCSQSWQIAGCPATKEPESRAKLSRPRCGGVSSELSSAPRDFRPCLEIRIDRAVNIAFAFSDQHPNTHTMYDAGDGEDEKTSTSPLTLR